MKGLPRPDLLVTCNNICGTVLKWYEALAERMKVPLYIIDTPFVAGELSDHAVAYVMEQLENFSAGLTRLTGRRLDAEKLRRILDYSNETVELWREIRYLCQNRPSPLNAVDLFIQLAPIVVLRGTPQSAAYYRVLLDEVKERVRKGQAAVEGEKYRSFGIT